MFLHGASRGPLGIAFVIIMIGLRMFMRRGMGGRGGTGRGPFNRRRGPFL